MEFFGHSAEYWLELKRRVDRGDPIGDAALLQEIVQLQGKVAFYESRIKQMAALAGIGAGGDQS